MKYGVLCSCPSPEEPADTAIDKRGKKGLTPRSLKWVLNIPRDLTSLQSSKEGITKNNPTFHLLAVSRRLRALTGIPGRNELLCWGCGWQRQLLWASWRETQGETGCYWQKIDGDFTWEKFCGFFSYFFPSGILLPCFPFHSDTELFSALAIHIAKMAFN